jgi:hypothetical protein
MTYQGFSVGLVVVQFACIALGAGTLDSPQEER